MNCKNCLTTTQVEVLLFLEGWLSRRLSVSPFNEVQLWLLPNIEICTGVAIT